MGKGDKKSRRGKIILGTFGARRRRKKAALAIAKPVVSSASAEIKTKKAVKPKAEPKEAAVTEKVIKEKTVAKTAKAPKEKKEQEEPAAEAKPKKEKKS
jgi:30S ribosomal protein S31